MMGIKKTTHCNRLAVKILLRAIPQTMRPKEARVFLLGNLPGYRADNQQATTAKDFRM
jgi:hypothetical protein